MVSGEGQVSHLCVTLKGSQSCEEDDESARVAGHRLSDMQECNIAVARWS